VVWQYTTPVHGVHYTNQYDKEQEVAYFSQTEHRAGRSFGPASFLSQAHKAPETTLGQR